MELFYQTGAVVGLVALLGNGLLWFRSFFLVASTLMLIAGLVQPQISWVVWSIIFFSANAVKLIVLWVDKKPILLPQHLKSIYREKFSTITTREFMSLLKLGEEISCQDQVLLNAGENPENIMLILSGRAGLYHQSRKVKELQVGDFLGTSYYLLHQEQAFDVRALGDLTFLKWSNALLGKLNKTKPKLINQLSTIMSINFVQISQGNKVLS